MDLCNRIRCCRLIFSVFVVAGFTLGAFAQSGRMKPRVTPTPQPQTVKGPSVRTVPAKIVAQTPTPVSTEEGDETIKVDSVLVPIPVSVVDASGRAVLSLKLSDFELRIDGKTAEIAELSNSDTPIRLAMLFDNSSSVFTARDFEREAAVRFFRSVIRSGKDQAALFSLADYTILEQPLTGNVDDLTRAIEGFAEPKGATALLEGIIKAASYLNSAAGRRVVVIVSDGEDTYSKESATLEKVIRALLVTDCQVYVLKTKDFENYKRTGQRGGNANIRTLTAEHRMAEIARQTGGAVYSPIDEREMRAAFERISADLSQQYVLSYYPENDAGAGGQFREISVTVKGRSNTSIRTRKGYYVPKR